VFDKIRTLFGELPESKTRGWKQGRYSFNVPVASGGGRCEACQGDGELTIEMNFLPDIHVPCEACQGRRYADETLDVKFKEKSIADVLQMTVAEARELFQAQPSIRRVLDCLHDVGLGYVKLGQSATSLSGGEAQRVKLAEQLSKRSTGKTLYILDEPTTGLHFADVHALVEVLDRLAESGNTVLVVEHNIDVIRVADYVVELGPEGGKGGGLLVASGTPEEIADGESPTAEFIREALERHGRAVEGTVSKKRAVKPGAKKAAAKPTTRAAFKKTAK
jgi:excinuclease ABC subunit A